MLHSNRSKFCSVLFTALPVILLLLALIPILLVGDCAHPVGDDYAYSIFLNQAMQKGESALGAILYTIKRYYFGWQGTYTAAVLMALQPGIWSEQAYILTPVIMLVMLLVPTALLTHTLLRRWLNRSRVEWLAVTCAFSLMTVLFQPSAAQAFYWWNGAVYYTFFFGLMLLLINCILRLRLEPKHPWLLMIAALVLAVLIGGGNYVTGLFSCLLCAGCALLYLIWDRPRTWQPLSIFLIMLACFLINALAPGNAVRQASSNGLGILPSILASMLWVFIDTIRWMDLAHIGFFLCMIPLLWHIAGKTSFRFPWPAAVAVLLFLALACQYTPHFYAMSTAGPGRLRNIIYDTWLWLLLLGEAYWIGWLRRVCKDLFNFPTVLPKVLVCLGIVLMLVGIASPLHGTTAGQCVQALSDGSAAAYDAHHNNWVEQFTSTDEEDVICPELTARPSVLYIFTLSNNPDEFANVAVANYYEKSSIIALPAEQISSAEKD